MQRSDRLRTLFLACLMGVVVALAVGLGALAMLRVAQEEGLPVLRHTTEAGAEAVGRAVAGQIDRALNYGIPLDRVNGLDTYLTNIVESLTQISGIAVLDKSGKTIFATAPSLHGPRFPLQAGGEEVGSVVIEIAPPFVEEGLSRLELALLVAGLFAGLNAGVVTYLFLLHHIDAAERHLRTTFDEMCAGRFAPTPPPGGRGIVVATFRALDQCFVPLRRAERRLQDAIATVRGIDFDGSLRQPLHELLEPVTMTASSAPERPGATANETVSSSVDGLALWPAALIVLAYTAASPLIPNYAIDREWALVPRSWWPVLPIIVDVCAIWAANFLASNLNRSLRDFLGLLGLLVAAGATTAIAFNHDYPWFLGLRALAGAGLGLALSAAFAGAPAFGQRRTTWRLLIYSGAVAGPMLGGLIAEATGRRVAFVILGVMLLASISSLPGLRHLPTTVSVPSANRSPIVTSLGLIGVILGASATWIPVGPGYDLYLAGGAAIAAVGVGIILILMLCRPPVVPPFTATWSVALGIVIGAALIGLTGLQTWQSFLAVIGGIAIMLIVSLVNLRRQFTLAAHASEGAE